MASKLYFIIFKKKTETESERSAKHFFPTKKKLCFQAKLSRKTDLKHIVKNQLLKNGEKWTEHPRLNKFRETIGGQKLKVKRRKTKCDCELKILIKKQNQFVDEC